MSTQYQPQTVSHPGETLREKLDELQMTPKEFAVRCDKADTIISEVLNGKRSITPEMAVQFEKVTKIPADFWLRRQSRYHENLARINQAAAAEAAIDWARSFPYAKMAKKGWVPATRRAVDKAIALFEFFGMSSHIAWEQYYLKAALPASFRISLAPSKKPHAISAWLRMGDLKAAKITAPAFDKKALRAALPELKAVMIEQPDDYRERAQKKLLATGLKLVYVPCIPGAPASGVARWIEKNTTPLIQLSNRWKRNDMFWFSLFHEIGHILLHGRKGIFIEDVNYEGEDVAAEAEANTFAEQEVFPHAQEAEVVAALPLTDEEICDYAERFGTHPAVIVGRLQFLGHYSPAQGHELIVKLDWGKEC